MNLLRDIVAALADGFKVLTEQPRYLVYALLVHLGFLTLFILSFEWTTTVRPEPPGEPVVQAALVNETDVKREVEKLKEAEARKAAEEATRQRRAEEQRKREEDRLADLKRQQEQTVKQAEEQRKRDEQAAKQAAEQRKQAEQAAKQAAEQRKQEEQRLAEVKKQQEEARKAEQARQAEERRRQEEVRKQEEQRLAEQKRREEEEARRRAEEQRQRDAQAAEVARRQQSEVDRYVGMIKQQVERAWIRPTNWQKGQQCVVRVNLIPGGDVVAVAVVRSCGDALANRSVEEAVWRAAPLQVPSADSALFDRFRELEFVFNPES